MHRLLLLSTVLTASLAAAAAAERPIPEPLREGAPVVIVGQISSPPAGFIGEQKMQVEVGQSRRDYSLHFNDAVIKGPNGERWDEDGLDDGQWVRAEGTIMDDPRRVRVDRLRVITAEEAQSIRDTAYYRTGYPYGYVAVLSDRDYPYAVDRYAYENGRRNGTVAEGARYGNGNGYYAPRSRVAGQRTYYRTRTTYVRRRAAK
jgi:hypothetical protein